MIKTLLNVFINNSSEPFSNNICIGGSNTWCHAELFYLVLSIIKLLYCYCIGCYGKYKPG